MSPLGTRAFHFAMVLVRIYVFLASRGAQVIVLLSYFFKE